MYQNKTTRKLNILEATQDIYSKKKLINLFNNLYKSKMN